MYETNFKLLTLKNIFRDTNDTVIDQIKIQSVKVGLLMYTYAYNLTPGAFSIFAEIFLTYINIIQEMS